MNQENWVNLYCFIDYKTLECIIPCDAVAHFRISLFKGEYIFVIRDDVGQEIPRENRLFSVQPEIIISASRLSVTFDGTKTLAALFSFILF